MHVLGCGEMKRRTSIRTPAQPAAPETMPSNFRFQTKSGLRFFLATWMDGERDSRKDLPKKKKKNKKKTGLATVVAPKESTNQGLVFQGSKLFGLISKSNDAVWVTSSTDIYA
jgi:hypothetical protein